MTYLIVFCNQEKSPLLAGIFHSLNFLLERVPGSELQLPCRMRAHDLAEIWIVVVSIQTEGRDGVVVIGAVEEVEDLNAQVQCFAFTPELECFLDR